MKFSIKISTLGTYQFVWSSRIGTGSSNTEHNDSWLKIKGDDFYGEKLSTGHIVTLKELEKLLIQKAPVRMGG